MLHWDTLEVVKELYQSLATKRLVNFYAYFEHYYIGGNKEKNLRENGSEWNIFDQAGVDRNDLRRQRMPCQGQKVHTQKRIPRLFRELALSYFPG